MEETIKVIPAKDIPPAMIDFAVIALNSVKRLLDSYTQVIDRQDITLEDFYRGIDAVIHQYKALLEDEDFLNEFTK